MASGGYEPVAELLLGHLDVGAFFMEFDSNDLTHDEQWASLELCVEVSDRVWG